MRAATGLSGRETSGSSRARACCGSTFSTVDDFHPPIARLIVRVIFRQIARLGRTYAGGIETRGILEVEFYEIGDMPGAIARQFVVVLVVEGTDRPVVGVSDHYDAAGEAIERAAQLMQQRRVARVDTTAAGAE